MMKHIFSIIDGYTDEIYGFGVANNDFDYKVTDDLEEYDDLEELFDAHEDDRPLKNLYECYDVIYDEEKDIYQFVSGDKDKWYAKINGKDVIFKQENTGYTTEFINGHFVIEDW